MGAKSKKKSVVLAAAGAAGAAIVVAAIAGFVHAGSKSAERKILAESSVA